MTAVRILPIGWRLTRDTITDPFVDGTISFYEGGTGNTSKDPATVYTDKDLATGARTTTTINSNGYPTYPNIWGSDALSYDVGILATGYNGGVEKIIPYAELAVTSDSGNTDTTPTFKNLLTNGSLYDWPGATTFSDVSGSGAAVETADGWFFAQASTASNALSRQAADATDGMFALRMGRPVSSTNTNKLRVFQALLTQDAYKCRGQTVTVSFSLKKGTNFSGTSVAILIATGTTEGEDPVLIDSSGWGGQVNVLSATQAPTTTSVRYEFAAAIGSNVKEIGVQLSYTPSGTAGADDWVQIENLQVEIAEEATSFEYVPLNTDYWRRNTAALASNAEFLARAATDRVLTPANLAARPYFRADKNGTNQTGIADATFTKVTYTNEVLDNGSYYDAPNSRWTPPAGLVSITAAAIYTGVLNDTGLTYVMFYKNGAQLSVGAPYRLSSTVAGNSITTILDLADGDDYYEVYVYVDVTASTSTVNGGVLGTYFEGVWLG